jgi:hypothetical protein
MRVLVGGVNVGRSRNLSEIADIESDRTGLSVAILRRALYELGIDREDMTN